MVALCAASRPCRHAEEARNPREDVRRRSTRRKPKAYLHGNPQSRDDRISVMTGAMRNEPLALTLGEPAGIGPDIALAAWLRRDELGLPPFYLLGDRSFFAARAQTPRPRRSQFADASPEAAPPTFRRALPVVATGMPPPRSRASRTRPARPPRSRRSTGRRPMCAPAAPAPSSPIRSPRACSTAPAFAIPATPNFSPSSRPMAARRRMPVMMLWSPSSRVVPVTIHLPLRDASPRLTTELIVDDRPHRRRAT